MSDVDNNRVIYIVYAYSCARTSSNSTKYIIGTYFTINDAIKRQHQYCGPDYETGVNTSIYGNKQCTFINILPFGDGKVELFAT